MAAKSGNENAALQWAGPEMGDAAHVEMDFDEDSGTWQIMVSDDKGIGEFRPLSSFFECLQYLAVVYASKQLALPDASRMN